MNILKFIGGIIQSLWKIFIIINGIFILVLLLFKPYIRIGLWEFIFRGNNDIELSMHLYRIPGLYILIMVLAIIFIYRFIHVIYQYYIVEWQMQLNIAGKWMVLLIVPFILSFIYIISIWLLISLIEGEFTINAIHLSYLIVSVYFLMIVFIWTYIAYKFYISFMISLLWVIATTRFDLDINILNASLFSRIQGVSYTNLLCCVLSIVVVNMLLFIELGRDHHIKFQRGDDEE
ncbi:hypothetical protein MUA77_03530 [Mammaliicoccus sciuri]|uniref:hypothetical protein n=1 Tax=Mammaliicoccus sciuri TaxID=1296 RepID=UPI0021D0B046|nr:hypothetical protein [Mammaliicoccus sciuri]UXU84511.1 hypothetical protein MUA77_03530 [Mammaliicoccus sciuri]UXU94359.1 hypothetical protein MUA42_03540 [Mammaliicoccus sciuri]UXV16307.1 hypothetical protein MUA89_03535 [Mammaliicoccus sciuri]UXV24569.1 hypothetical protein MUA49_03535 [Mammaliicoccus sciuri]UXV27352.1 hypothetical protein MUA96_03535 [Mammaliicoccus sciuri]